MKTPLKSVGFRLSGDGMGAETVSAATTSMPSAPAIDSSTLGQPFLKRVTSFPALLAALLVGAVFVRLREFDVDPDLWWHIKVGQDILATHHFPTADAYSFTAHGTPWMACEWVGDTLFAAVQRAWGLQGLMALDLALGAAILLALCALAWLRSRNSKAAFVSSALLLPLTFGIFGLRPQMLGCLFLILTLIILECFRQGRSSALWLLPPLFLVWVNTHGSFAVGVFTLAVYGISGLFEIRRGGIESRRWTANERLRLSLAFLASLIALAVTPYGVKLAGYPMDMALFHPNVVANIQEWLPMPFNAPMGKFFLALLLGFLLAQIILRLTWQLAELTLFLAGVVVACLHARFVLVFVPFCAPLLAVILSRWLPPYQAGKDKYILNALLMATVVAGVVRFFPSRAQLERRVAEQWPVKAVQYLKQHPPPRPMFNSHGFGGYLIYALDGQNKVFIDGRNDIYERTGVFADYGSISLVAPNALLLLQAYDVHSCLIERNEALGTLLAVSPLWQKVYTDNLSALFVRTERGK